MLLESRRQLHLGHFNTIETIRLLAHLTVEVWVLVVIVVLAVTTAELIACAVAATFDGMHQVLLTEEGEGSEDIRLVDGLDPALQFRQRLGQHRAGQRLHHHDAIGSGFDVVLLEQLDVGSLIHLSLFCRIRLQRYKIISRNRFFCLYLQPDYRLNTYQK